MQFTLDCFHSRCCHIRPSDIICLFVNMYSAPSGLGTTRGQREGVKQASHLWFSSYGWLRTGMTDFL